MILTFGRKIFNALISFGSRSLKFFLYCHQSEESICKFGLARLVFYDKKIFTFHEIDFVEEER